MEVRHVAALVTGGRGGRGCGPADEAAEPVGWNVRVHSADPSTPRRRDMSRHLPHGGMPLLERLGVAFSRAEAGSAEGTWSPANEACNPNGTIQGGLFGTVFDAAMSMAIHSALPPEDSCVSLELRAATPGGGRAGDMFTLTARVLRLGTTAIFAEATATRDGELVATGSGTFLRRRKPARNAAAARATGS